MESWSNLCRCCLSQDSTVSIFDHKLNVRQKFLEITTIEVDKDDGLPQRLCSECYHCMESAYQFRSQTIKMNSQLKIQLESLLQQELANQNENSINADSVEESITESDDQNNDALKQIESIIKKEPMDSDDDYYYVLVIDDPKDKEKKEEMAAVTKIKQEQENIEHVFEKEDSKSSEMAHPFQSKFDFLISNTKVSANVPATILENEEECQDNDGAPCDSVMDIDEGNSQESEKNLPQNEDSQEQDNENKFIQILATTTTDGTILVQGKDGIQYLSDTQLMTDDNGDSNQEEVVYCEGDDSSQFKIVNVDGSELVIEYADGDQIATVLQQEDGSFLCECGEQFDDLAVYEKHQSKHNPSGALLCNLCGKGFDSAEILTGHMVLHSVSGLLVSCPFCNQLIKRNTLTQHIKFAHNNIKPQCDLCSKTFANPNNLKRHMMIHSGVRLYECDICLKRFHQKITMQTHRLTHLTPYGCNECDESYDSKEALTVHKESEECTRSKVQKVKEQLIKSAKQEITTQLGKLLGYACSLCNKMFSVESALEQHIDNTHMVDPSELLCSECGEVLPTKKDMQSHIMTHKNYNNRNIKRFECGTCSKSCSSQAMLIMHERVHTNERPYPCGLCSLRFKTKTHLRTHQLTHTREKKFGCSVCMKFFALKGNLVVHLRTHTGERPYVCSICNEAFIDSKYLKKHKMRKHSIENVPWNQY